MSRGRVQEKYDSRGNRIIAKIIRDKKNNEIIIEVVIQ